MTLITATSDVNHEHQVMVPGKFFKCAPVLQKLPNMARIKLKNTPSWSEMCWWRGCESCQQYLKSGLALSCFNICSPKFIAYACGTYWRNPSSRPAGASGRKLTAHLSGTQGNWNKSEIFWGFTLHTACCLHRRWERGVANLNWK